MSMLLMVQAMKIKVGNPTRKLVLIKLADNANDDGICWPSYQNIADHCEVTKRSVMSHVAKLEEMGFLKRQHRKTDDGSMNKSNYYYLSLSGENISSGSENISSLRSENISPRTSHSLEPVKEPINVPAKASTSKKDSYPDEFEWIWANKPNREGGNPKKQAYQACNARIKDGVTWRDMAEGLKRYKDYCDAKGLINTPMVQQMSTFFGTKESFKELWSINNAANQQATTSTGRRLTAEEERNQELLRKYGNTATPTGWAGNSAADSRMDQHEVQRSVSGKVEQEGFTIDLDSGDWSSHD